MSALVAHMIARLLPGRFERDGARDLDATFALRVTVGRRAAPVTVRIDPAGCAAKAGLSGPVNATAGLTLADLLRVALGRASWPELIAGGRLSMQGDPFLALRLPGLFRLPLWRRSLPNAPESGV